MNSLTTIKDESKSRKEVIYVYMYPDNLAGKPTLWLWYLRDIGIIGVGAIFSVIAISQANIYFPFAIVGTYAFLTIRFEGTSIFDFIQYACAYFLYQQQLFYWSYSDTRDIENTVNRKRKSSIWRLFKR